MEIDARSPQGNAFAIMGAVKSLLDLTDRSDEWPEIRERMTSGDYDNLCRIAEEATFGSIMVVNRMAVQDN